MPRSSSFTRATVLRTTPYGESDLVVSLFTEAFGRISAFARSARKSRRRFGPALEPFQKIEVEVSASQGATWKLSQARIEHAFEGITQSWKKIQHGARVLELVTMLSPQEHPDARLFETLMHCLERMDRSAAREEWVLIFQMKALSICGFQPRFERCALCETPLPEGKSAYFDARRGSIVCRACGGASRRVSSGALQVLRRDVGLEEDEPSWGENICVEVRALLDEFMSYHLDFQSRH